MASIKITSGSRAGETFDLDKDETTIGRISENVISLEDASVSSRHCCILRDGNKFTLRDTGSTNGTRINDKKVTEDCRLKPKDAIAIGSVQAVFEGEDVEVEAPPTTTRGRPIVTVQPGSMASVPSMGGSSPFNRKRDNKAIWMVALVFIGVLAVGAFGWFLFKLIALK